MRRSSARLNFFPMGLRAGPKGQAHLLPRSNFHKFSVTGIPALNKDGKPNPVVKHRRMLQLKCDCCRFAWAQEKLVVRCTQHKDHYQQEAFVDPKWMYNINYAYSFYRFIGKTIHPRTGQHVNSESTKSQNNQRRALMGMSNRTMNIEKEKRQLAAQISGVGSFSKQWKTIFPYPT